LLDHHRLQPTHHTLCPFLFYLFKTNLIFKGLSRSGRGAKFWSEEQRPGYYPRYINLPLSQITFDKDTPEGDVVEVELPLWLANNEGLI
jgi:hypothetical protein